MKKIILIALFVSSLFAGNANIDNLEFVKVISTSDCKGINLDVNFKTDSSVIEKDSYVRIKKFADYMDVNSDKKALIAGYTDSRGSDTHNLALSKRRAKAVYQQLIDYGVDASRLSNAGYGEEDPVATNSTETGRRSNRRIEAQLY